MTTNENGPLRVAQELALQGINVSAGGVRGVWQRHDLLSKHGRLLRLEKTHREQTIELNDEQIRLLERFSPEFRERQIEVHYTGELVAVDTFFVGALKSVGTTVLYCTGLDCYSRHAWGVYTSKLPVTSVHVLNETVLPFFEAHEARVYTILSDNGREFCGRPDHHPYELFLQLEGIEHRTTKVRRPQSNGFIERLHRTLLDEHFRIKGRTTWYESVEQMQTDLDSQWATSGQVMEGQAPYSMFNKGLKLIPKEVRTKVA
jgi:transposase InsO family protein